MAHVNKSGNRLTVECLYYQEVDYAEHNLFRYPGWERERMEVELEMEEWITPKWLTTIMRVIKIGT